MDDHVLSFILDNYHIVTSLEGDSSTKRTEKYVHFFKKEKIPQPLHRRMHVAFIVLLHSFEFITCIYSLELTASLIWFEWLQAPHFKVYVLKARIHTNQVGPVDPLGDIRSKYNF
jgi:hypothetical protein